MFGTILSAMGFSNNTIIAEIPNLTNKIALVTGGNTGIGLITCEELSAKGAKVYLAARSAERANAAIAQVKSKQPEAKIEFLPFDMTDVISARKAAQVIIDKETRLDIVVANAGVMAFPYKLVNGVEVQFWNHLGHYALIQPLLPLMIETSKKHPESSARIISVASLGHQFSPLPDFSSLAGVNAEMGSTWKRYGQSKLSNILYANALQKHLAEENIAVLSLHPGNINTELTRGPIESYGFFGKVMRFASGYLAMTPAEGAKTQLYAATSPEVDLKKLRGAYLTPIATVATPNAMARNEELAEQLWRLSAQLVEEAVKADGSAPR